MDFELTTSDLTRASSGNIEKLFAGRGGGGYYIGIDWKVNSQSASSNSSNVTASFYIRTSGSGYTIQSKPNKSVTLTINGTSYNGQNTVGMGVNQKKNLITKTVDVKHNSDGTKTCSFSCSGAFGLTLSGTYYGTVTHSGSGTFNTINLNTAPTWTSNDTRIKVSNQELKADKIIPENAGAIEVISATATDKEQSSLNYEIHRYINNSYSAKIKSSGNSLVANDNLSSWGAGTKFKYEAKVHDGTLYASTTRWSWEYTKNTFTKATVESIKSINNGTNKFSFKIKTAKNSGGGNGLVNTSFTYKIESLTSGVNIYGTNSTSVSSQSDITFEMGIANNGSAHGLSIWLDANEIKSALKSSNYYGNIKLRIVSSNSYGSQGSYDFNVSADFRESPPNTTVTYGEDNKINFKGQDYYVASYLPFKLEWGEIRDSVNNAPCTYDIYYQIDSQTLMYVDTTANTYYTAYLGSISEIGNKKIDRFRMIVRAKTSYGTYSDSTGDYITLWDYAISDISVSSVNRKKESVEITGSVTINTSIPDVSPTKTHYRWVKDEVENVNFDTQGSGKTRNFTLNIEAAIDVSGQILIAASDEIADLIHPISSVPWSNLNVNVKAYMSIMSLTKDGLGIYSKPKQDYRLTVGGNTNLLGDVVIEHQSDIISSSNPKSKLEFNSNNEILLGITSSSDTTLKDYITVATNKLTYTTNSRTYNIYHDGNFDAADKNHNHDSTYLKLSGGTLSGSLECSDGIIIDKKASRVQALLVKTDDGNGNGDGHTHIGYTTNGKYYHYFRGNGGTIIDTKEGLNVSGTINGQQGMTLAHSIYLGSSSEDNFRAVHLNRSSKGISYVAKFGVSYENGKLGSSDAQEVLYGAVIESHNTSGLQGRYVFTNKCLISTPDNSKYLGTSTHRWKAAYCTEGKFYTSTKSAKTNIVSVDDNCKATTFSLQPTKTTKDIIIEALKDTPMKVYNYKTRMPNGYSLDVRKNPMFVGFIADDLYENHPEFFDLIGEYAEHERDILDENGDKTGETVKEAQYDISDISMLGVLWTGIQEALLKIDSLEKQIENLKSKSN